MEYELLSQLRKDQNLTQKELADVLEIRQAAISKPESQSEFAFKTTKRHSQSKHPLRLSLPNAQVYFE